MPSQNSLGDTQVWRKPPLFRKILLKLLLTENKGGGV